MNKIKLEINSNMTFTEILQNSVTPNAASHSNASWYTNTEGFLEHSPSEGSLNYKGPPSSKRSFQFWGSLLYNGKVIQVILCRPIPYPFLV